MNATNRLTNRALLFVVGAVLLATGVAALAAGVLSGGNAPTWLQRPAAFVGDVWDATVDGSRGAPVVGTIPMPVLLIALTAVLLTALLVVFIATRKRGRTDTVLDVDAAGGRTRVDRSVADAVLAETLLSRPDILSARTGAYRIGRTRALELDVVVRPGAPLADVLTAAETAVREWDELLGARMPILLHLSDRRWHDAFRARARAR